LLFLLIKRYHFIDTGRICVKVECPSVRPSVRLSVCMSRRSIAADCRRRQSAAASGQRQCSDPRRIDAESLEKRSIVMSMSVCLCVCPQVYLPNCMSNYHQIFTHVAHGRGSPLSGTIAICYVLLVLRVTSRSHTTARNRRRETAYTQSDSTEGNKDLVPRRILKLNHQGQYQTGGGV